MRRSLLALSVLVAIALLPLGAATAKKPAPTCDGLPATLVGTNGDDILLGTPGPDVIVGLKGDDTISGGPGDDVICGGKGDDTLSGQGEDDRLFGEHGDDVLDGGEGGCCINMAANTGDDFLSGGQGEDVLHTSDFPTLGNTLRGNQGNDQLFVWSGGWAYGGNGRDTIRQFTGNAFLSGGNGRDDILDWDDGGIQNETLTLAGGNGRDVLRSEDTTSISTLDGGNGSDTCSGGDTTTHCES